MTQARIVVLDPSMSDVTTRLNFILDAYPEAAKFVMGYYESASLQVEWKSDQTPVTLADRGAEQLLRERIAARFPHDAILGEEFGETPGTSGYRWILDPVDGTKSFVSGVPVFGMLIGLQYQGACVAGVCGFPALNEVVYASQGSGTWRKQGENSPVRCRVRSTSKLSEALFCFTSAGGWDSAGTGKRLPGSPARRGSHAGGETATGTCWSPRASGSDDRPRTGDL